MSDSPDHADLPPDEIGPCASASARRWAELIGELRALRYLGDDWDGQGAEATPSACVGGAIMLAARFQAYGLQPADYAVAGVSGTVVFEWHDATRYVEIEVTTPDSAEGRAVQKESGVTAVFTVYHRS
jgi:hypothetical protein